MIKKHIAIFILFFCSFTLCAQQFGGTPPAIQWQQINTDTARIIFPKGLENIADSIANTIHKLAYSNALPLGNKLRKINIVLQYQTVQTNGYVGLGPFRSEFYLTAPSENFSLGSLPWTQLLSLHEYRHVQQFNNFENGISKAMKILFGEEGYSLAINAAIPDWFFEGDAVYTETILSEQGRGRLSAFQNNFNALWQANKKYSWMKLRNGSLRHSVPNHYQLGYLLVKYGYQKFGDDFWQKVTQEASRYKGVFYPFQRAIKKQSGLSYKKFYTAALNEYETIHRNNDHLKNSTTNQAAYLLSASTVNYVTDYLFPQIIGQDSVLFLKKTYRHRPVFIVRTNGKEHRIRIRDIALNDYFSYRNGSILYTAYEKDLRWSWRDYSVIKQLDLASGKQKTITEKTKYFTPDLSPDNKKIVAVHKGITTKAELHILNSTTGAIEQQIASDEIYLYATPKFIDDDNIVAAASYTDGTMALVKINLQTPSAEKLTPTSYNVTGYPFVKNDTIYFSASYAGNDDIFALQLSDGIIKRVSKGSTGNYFPSAGNGKIIWSTATADGYRLQEMDAKNSSAEPMSEASLTLLLPQYAIANRPETVTFLNTADSNRNFTKKPYKKSTGLLNLHSWRPYYEDPILTYSLYGENVLNTLQSQLYYLYNENEKSNAIGFNTRYGGWFPFINTGAEYTADRSRVIGSRMRNWSELDAYVGFSIPLNMVKGKTISAVNIQSNYYYRGQFNQGFYKDSLGNTGFGYLQHAISITQQSQKAVQHILPKWGYQLSLQHRHTVGNIKSWQFAGSFSCYVPGIAANHSIALTGAFQETDTATVVFADRFSYSRGYQNPYFARAWRLSGNYHLPLLHPDFGFANLLYISRVRANLFYDFTTVFSINKKQTLNQRSGGAEIYFDTKWWNQYELSFGLRLSYLFDKDFIMPTRKTLVELILPVTIFPR